MEEEKETGALLLAPAFEAHIRKLENWTFGHELVDAFPFLSGIQGAVS
jgi:hypothetical protein